jgi:riboflavin synthase
VAKVERVVRKGALVTLTLRFPSGALEGASVGGSISIAGVCLTATSLGDSTAFFDVIDETLRCTTLGDLVEGDAVNFERSATLGDEIGGHLLSGHIAGTVEIVGRDEEEGNLKLTLRPPVEHQKHILPKGYVALDGCSLTVGSVDASSGVFAVHLIPETRRVTTLDARAVGDRLNLEVDAWTQAVVATVERVLASRDA